MRKLLSYYNHPYFKRITLVILAITISLTLIPSSVFAIDESFYSSNDILFYNPDDKTCSVSGSATGANSLSGSDNEQKIYNFWISQGLSSAQAAGITGSMQHEGTFSPFRQEDGYPWPTRGYGIAQFTNGQRTAVTQALSVELGSTFTQYYTATYGGPGTVTSGYIPAGVPPDVNDKFLLAELNYLSSYISKFAPSTISDRVSKLQSDYSITVPSGMKLFDFLKTLTSAGDAAKAWTYLYEYPGDIKSTAADRASSADAVLDQYSGGSSNNSNCASGSTISCSSNGGSTSTVGDNSTATIIGVAKCLTFQPPNSRQQGIDACTSGGCTNGPTTPASYDAARKQFSTVGDNKILYYGADCGNFVSTVMRMSGADPNYPVSGVSSQYQYMASHPEKYQQVTTTTNTSGLMPGDIATEVGNGHTFIYLGDGQIAQASQGTEMPNQQSWYGMNVVIWRLK